MKPTANLPPKQIFEKPPKRNYNTGAKERVHLDLFPHEKLLFEDLSERMKAGSMILAFRRTLSVMEQLVVAIEEGRRPVIIDDELNELEIIEL